MDYLFNFIILALIYFLFFYKKWRRRGTLAWILRTTMYVYFVLVIYVTLMPLSIPTGTTNALFMETANLIPFRDIRMQYGGAVREVYLNILMMMPFGFLFPIIKKKGLFTTVILTFLFSFAIETTQLLSVWLGINYHRAFDVTDLITNTFGGLVGYIIFAMLRVIRSKIIYIK